MIEDKINYKLLERINNFPTNFLRNIARDTLSKTETYIPLSNEKNTEKLRASTMSAGVKQVNKLHYYLTSPTSYARHVWFMDNIKTHWTTPGTGSKWFETQFKKNQKMLIKGAIKKSL